MRLGLRNVIYSIFCTRSWELELKKKNYWKKIQTFKMKGTWKSDRKRGVASNDTSDQFQNKKTPVIQD